MFLELVDSNLYFKNYHLNTLVTRVVALTWASMAWTFLPSLGLDGFGFKAEADNSGQNGWKIHDCCLLHSSTADNKVLKVGDEIKFTLLASSVALQPVSQHSWGVSVSAVLIIVNWLTITAVTNFIIIIVVARSSRRAVTAGAWLSVHLCSDSLHHGRLTDADTLWLVHFNMCTVTVLSGLITVVSGRSNLLDVLNRSLTT